MSELPSSAKIVIIGGGIVGCSVAYHLGKMGITGDGITGDHDLERNEKRQADIAEQRRGDGEQAEPDGDEAKPSRPRAP